MFNRYYIYKMIHLPSGRVYVGQRKLPKGKTPETDNYHGSGVIWRRIYKAHPEECVKVIICEAKSKEEVDELERRYIAHYKSVWGSFCVNITDGGGGIAGYHHTEEYKQMMREKFKGQTIPTEQREKISETLKNRWKNLPEEEKEKHRESRRNQFNNMSPEQQEQYREKMSNSCKEVAAKRSNEWYRERAEKQSKSYTSERRSQVQKNRWANLTDEERSAMGQAQKNRWSTFTAEERSARGYKAWETRRKNKSR